MISRGLAVARVVAIGAALAVPTAAVGQSPAWEDLKQCGSMVVQSRSTFDDTLRMTVLHVQVRSGRTGGLLFGPLLVGEPFEAACLNDTTVTMRAIAPVSGDAFLEIVGEDGAVTTIGDGYIKNREWSADAPVVIDPMARPLVRPQHLKFFVFEDLGWGRILEPRR